MSTVEADEQRVDRLMNEPTLASTWGAVAGSPITDEFLEWPPDLFTLTNVLLERAEAFRFALAPVGEWPPARFPDWARAVEETGRKWSVWVENRRGAVPDLLAEEWGIFREREESPLEQLAQGDDRRLCEAMLTLHAIADEACADLGVALDSSDGEASVYRARGRELLARTESLARVSTRFLRVLPKVRTPHTGRPSFSRYACVQGPGIERGGTRCRRVIAARISAPSSQDCCSCRGRCGSASPTSARSRTPCRDWQKIPSASSSLHPLKLST